MSTCLQHLGLVSAVGLVCVAGLGCAIPTESEEYSTNSQPVVRSWTTWEPLDSFNSSVWQKADWANGDPMFRSAFRSDHIGFASGKMAMTLDNAASSGRSYTGAEYRTWDTFTYGSFETNMIATKYSGVVSSFFTYTNSPVWDEIDVEFLGKDTTIVQFNYFVNGVGGHERIHRLGFDASAAYHKYKIEWGNGYINWYVDGVWAWGVNNTGLNARYGAPMPSHPMKIMANLWAGSGVDSWLGPFNYTGPAKAHYDYILYSPM